MASGKRLIDANAMRDEWLYNGKNEYIYDTNAVLDSIDSQPTVDAVEVVRCRDCEVPHNKYTGCPNLNGLVTPPDFYCPFGERKGDDSNG